MNPIKTMAAHYEREQNIHISSFWDGGWLFKIGDETNGFTDELNTDSLQEGFKWLEECLANAVPYNCDTCANVEEDEGGEICGQCCVLQPKLPESKYVEKKL